MINNDFRFYDYYTYGQTDEYGQDTLQGSAESAQIAIYINSQTASDNILFKDATYIGLTPDDLSDNCVVDYNGALLKVIYVNPQGRLNQLFMVNM